MRIISKSFEVSTRKVTQSKPRMKLNNNVRLIRLVVYDGLLVFWNFVWGHVLTEQEGAGAHSSEAIRSSKGGYVSRFRDKENCSLFFLACELNELEPDYVWHHCSLTTRRDSPRGVLPYKRLMWMCRWMGSHFHDWIDNNGVAFSVELLEWGRTFLDFLG